MKLDTEKKEKVYWNEDNCWPSEPVFVPRPNGESEDDGEITARFVTCIKGQITALKDENLYNCL